MDQGSTIIPNKDVAIQNTIEHDGAHNRIDDCQTKSRGEKAIEDAYQRYDIPVERRKIDVVVFEHGPFMTHASAGVYGCGEYSWEGEAWYVEEQPDGYIVYLYAEKHVCKDFMETARDVRHELAHIVNWEIDGYTLEGKDNHKEWLDRLDAPTNPD